jgi:hypothetical protein
MADAFNTFTKLIQSPVGQLAAGGVLAGIVSKFFERVEEVLNDDTKLEIAVWLLDRTRVEPQHPFQISRSLLDGIQTWLDNIHATERSFKRTWKLLGIATCSLAVVTLVWEPHSISRKILTTYTKNGGFEAAGFFGSFFFTSLFLALGTHAALLATKHISAKVARTEAAWSLVLLLSLHLLLTVLFFLMAVGFLLILASFDPDVRSALSQLSERAPTVTDILVCSRLAIMKTLPFVITAIPMMAAGALTTGFVCFALLAGFLLKAAHQFDIGFDWFNRKFDIEKKPLHSIGLVVGGMVAVVYWAAVIVSRVVG